MRPATKIWPSAAVLLTGLSRSGKTTLSRALVRCLKEFGLEDVVLIDGEELRARLPRRYGHSLADREEVWREIVKEARRELQSGKVVVIGSIAHRASMRAWARKRLQPFFEVHLDCPVDVCAARDRTGQYQRAFASEYECFIGVTHPYESADAADLRIDTGALSPEEAERLLLQQVLDFLATPADNDDLPGEWVRRRVQHFVANGPMMDLPRFRRWLLREAKTSKPVVCMQRPSCAQLMVIYGGMDAYLGTQGSVNDMSPLEFLRVSGLFGRNLAWIRDPYGENFLRGISAEISNAETLAEWTRQYAISLPHVREVHAVGYSSGSYGAMMFGHLCKMKSVWAFSPRCAHAEGAEEAKAYLQQMLSSYNGVTQYHVWYSALNKRDKDLADVLGACPGVTVHPYRETGDDHYLIRYLAENGILKTILPPFVASESSPLQRDSAAASGRHDG